MKKYILKNNLKNSLKNKNGMTIIELMVAVSVVGVMSVVAVQFVTDQNKKAKKMEDAIEYKIDTLLADKVILKDFRNSAPSVNQLYVSDSNQVNFFDHDSDTNGALYASSPYKFRSLTLNSQNVGSKKLYLLISNLNKGESVFTDPVIAYDVLPASATDINEPAPLTFVGLNRNGFLAAKNPKLLEPNTLLFVDSAGLMKVTAENKASRSAAYVGFSDTSGNVIANPPLPDGIFVSKIYSGAATNPANPLAGTQNIIVTADNFDEFLKNLPANGTSGSSIRVSAVKLIRYQLNCSASSVNPGQVPVNEDQALSSKASNSNVTPVAIPTPTYSDDCTLNRAEWAGSAGFTNERAILQNIKSVTFKRESITNTMAAVSYVRNKK